MKIFNLKKLNTVIPLKNSTRTLLFNCNLNMRFLSVLESLLYNAKIVILEKTIFFDKNEITFNLKIFYKSTKIENYKNILALKCKNQLKNIKEVLMEMLISSSSCENIKFFKINLNVLNKKLDKNLTLFFYIKLKRFEKILFSRRLPFFIDFLKITSLLCTDDLVTQRYVELLSSVFKVIPKSAHSKYFFFLESLILLIVKNPFVIKLSTKPKVCGMKSFVLGKLKGKLRKSSTVSQIGQIPSQSVCKQVTVGKINSHTRLGVFGFTLWINRK